MAGLCECRNDPPGSPKAVYGWMESEQAAIRHFEVKKKKKKKKKKKMMKKKHLKKEVFSKSGNVSVIEEGKEEHSDDTEELDSELWTLIKRMRRITHLQT
ncbi:hypothetical protein ANN_11269 [Periplaneta americana]|uniref:Uncharacterized protein n=1 Tax=Periplaneta americana TaxID=6978 RepID=A0ABQ8T4J6_PERAM|nr:hypothetical protein ANN_11269 [Periplaneta americana]